MSPPPVADDGAGRLSIEGARYLLIRPETLAALQKAAEGVLGWDAAECLAAGGRAGGARAAAALPGEREARVRRLIERGSALGWGRFALEELADDRLVVRSRTHRSPRPTAPRRRPSATSRAACWSRWPR
jgi:hypothetical protein